MQKKSKQHRYRQLTLRNALTFDKRFSHQRYESSTKGLILLSKSVEKQTEVQFI